MKPVWTEWLGVWLHWQSLGEKIHFYLVIFLFITYHAIIYHLEKQFLLGAWEDILSNSKQEVSLTHTGVLSAHRTSTYACNASHLQRGDGGSTAHSCPWAQRMYLKNTILCFNLISSHCQFSPGFPQDRHAHLCFPWVLPDLTVIPFSTFPSDRLLSLLRLV
jgi:hypothetical protein